MTTANTTIVDASQWIPGGAQAAEVVRRDLSELVQYLQCPTILKIAADVRAILAQGRDVCNLTIGDFSAKEFPVPVILIDAIHESLAQGNTNYPPPDGVVHLRQAITRLYER